MVKERNQSIELLRLSMMSLIVFGHIIGFGIGGGRYNEDGTSSICALLQPLYLYHVDAFIFISGYYGIRLKWNRFAELILKMIVYSAVAYLIASTIIPDMGFSVGTLLKNLYPITACDWWFMAQYLYLMLMAPFLNSGVEKLSKKQLGVLVIAIYILSFRGFSCLLLFVYLLGRYMRCYPIDWFEKHAGKVFIFTVFAFFCLNLLLLHYNIYPKKLYEYMSPFCIIPGVAIFYTFKKFTIKLKFIGSISAGVLAAYLITTHELLQIPFHKIVVHFLGNNILVLLCAAMVIVISFAFIDRYISFPIRKSSNLITNINNLRE